MMLEWLCLWAGYVFGFAFGFGIGWSDSGPRVLAHFVFGLSGPRVLAHYDLEQWAQMEMREKKSEIEWKETIPEATERTEEK